LSCSNWNDRNDARDASARARRRVKLTTVNAGQVDFNRVAMFVQIASAGGVTAAAARLKLPKSSVSRSLSQLERELGVELVVRTSRQFRLTDAGQSFFRTASKGIATVDAARDEVRRDSATPQGLVRIAAPGNIANSMLPAMITRFVRSYPRVQVDVCVTAQQMHPVRDGFDLVFGMGKPSDSSAKVRSIGKLEMGIFATATYLREFGRPGRPSDLAKHDCILRSPTGKKDRWRLVGPKGSVVVAVDGHIRVDDSQGALAMASADGGLAVLPLRLPAAETRYTTLERVLPDYVVRGAVAYLIYAAQRHTPLHVAMLRDAILEETRATCSTVESYPLGTPSAVA
jgi:DNA-binding transcriptional LysR family regulator